MLVRILNRKRKQIKSALIKIENYQKTIAELGLPFQPQQQQQVLLNCEICFLLRKKAFLREPLSFQ
jgi:hypothetical protein